MINRTATQLSDIIRDYQDEDEQQNEQQNEGPEILPKTSFSNILSSKTFFIDTNEQIFKFRLNDIYNVLINEDGFCRICEQLEVEDGKERKCFKWFGPTVTFHLNKHIRVYSYKEMSTNFKDLGKKFSATDYAFCVNLDDLEIVPTVRLDYL